MTNPRDWAPALGAWPTPDGIAFRVWAPRARQLDVVLERENGEHRHALEPARDGTFSGVVREATPGDRYWYCLDDGPRWPDPASRRQPLGVHGPSEVVDPRAFQWTDAAWTGPSPADLIFYELHVGTFSPEGTFAGVRTRLPAIAALGATAIELMPVADFPGARNWGYDGVAAFAPARCYGTPDDLRHLVDAAHGLGLAVFLDVVYNHFGPDGAYAVAFSPSYLTDRHRTPWGAAINFDGHDSTMVRAFFIENACHWVREYHIDGLRLDATHAIADDSSRHVLAELAARVRASASDRRVLVVAEDHRNLNWVLQPEDAGGWGVDAVWADGFHHHMRRLLAGDSEGYFRDYSGTTEDLATTMRQGWFHPGQQSVHFSELRGTDPAGLALEQFVICLQNHDQVGNRALGTRLNEEIDLAAYRAASIVLLLAPETPLLFMGQEWAASTPFLYFTDHHADLGRLVTEGRRQEFRHFAAFSDPERRRQIPDPQALSTFLDSRLRWNERDAEPHAGVLRLYTAALALRRRSAAWRDGSAHPVSALDAGTIAFRRGHGSSAVVVVARLKGSGRVDLGRVLADDDGQERGAARRWTVELTSEDPQYCAGPKPPAVGLDAGATVDFRRPSAVILTASPIVRAQT